jgi:hypothetical protein
MNRTAIQESRLTRLALIPVNGVQLEGMLVIPHRAKGVVLFAHGSGSSRHSPRNNFVAEALHEVGFGTLERATQWLMEQRETQALDIGSGARSRTVPHVPYRRRSRRPSH